MDGGRHGAAGPVQPGHQLGARLRRLSARHRRDDGGSAVADFALVGGLVTLLFAGLLQLGVALDVHNTLVDDVGEGARFGALADRTPADGAARARALIGESFPAAYADHVSARTVQSGAGAQVEVSATVPVPLLGVLGGPFEVVVVGHGAVQELP